VPATSASQQRLMGMVHAAQKGKLKRPSKKVKEMASSMKEQDVTDFAKTKHEGLPEKKAAAVNALCGVFKVMTKQAISGEEIMASLRPYLPTLAGAGLGGLGGYMASSDEEDGGSPALAALMGAGLGGGAGYMLTPQIEGAIKDYKAAPFKELAAKQKEQQMQQQIERAKQQAGRSAPAAPDVTPLLPQAMTDAERNANLDRYEGHRQAGMKEVEEAASLAQQKAQQEKANAMTPRQSAAARRGTRY
jgi:hypothetical protein